MAFTKKTWKDRIAEYPTRRRLTKSDGSTELVTVSREEGTVSQEGDAFSAANMNNLETRVKNAFDAVDSSLSGKVGNFTSGNYKAVTGLAYDATNKKLGLKVGADTVIPFSGDNGSSNFLYGGGGQKGGLSYDGVCDNEFFHWGGTVNASNKYFRTAYVATATQAVYANTDGYYKITNGGIGSWTYKKANTELIRKNWDGDIFAFLIEYKESI